jgi:biopolymer transport protein ExbD
MKTLTFASSFETPSDAVETANADVTPVMNLFIILIPFLISMAVFTHLSIVEFSVPPNVGASLDPSNGKPKLKLTAVVAADYIVLTCGETVLDSIAFAKNATVPDTVLGALRTNRERADVHDEVIVAVQDAVPFERIVAVMDMCKQAGFIKLGLSNATVDPSKGA